MTGTGTTCSLCTLRLRSGRGFGTAAPLPFDPAAPLSRVEGQGSSGVEGSHVTHTARPPAHDLEA
jgi:hypothetical protein